MIFTTVQQMNQRIEEIYKPYCWYIVMIIVIVIANQMQLVWPESITSEPHALHYIVPSLDLYSEL